MQATEKEKQRMRKRWREIKSDPVRMERDRITRRRYMLSSKFGITTDQYNQLLEQQNHRWYM